jgi:multiple sugar transport system permease protein
MQSEVSKAAIPKADRSTKRKGIRRWKHWSNYMFILPGALFVLCFLVFPIFYNFLLSFQNVTFMNLNGEHEFVGWKNYITIFQDPVFPISFKNSIIFTIGSMIFQFIIGFALALFFNRKFPGSYLMRSLILLGWMMPIVITGTLFKWMLSGDSGVFNHLLLSIGIIEKPISWLIEENTALVGTIIANIWIGVPFNMIIILAGLQGLPKNLYEAAKIDGASRLRQFVHITLPLMRPTILILIMLVIIYTFKVFDLIFVMTGGGPINATTIFPLYAYKLAFTNYELSLGSTVSSIMFCILLIFASIYLWLMRKEEQQ